MNLSPCPFCSGEAGAIRTKDNSGWWYVECTKCYTRQLASETKTAAEQAWNVRATETPEPET